jgi:hypothetical protein
MGMPRPKLTIIAVLALCLTTAPSAFGTTPRAPMDLTNRMALPDPPQRPTPPPPVPPDNLDRIREAVNRPARLKIEDGQLRIYVQVIAKWPSFAEMVKGYDLKHGPARGNPMSHSEFLGMVTPKDMYSTGGGIRPGELLTMAMVNYLGQAVIKRGLREIREARSAAEIREIRERIDRELAALKGGR